MMNRESDSLRILLQFLRAQESGDPYGFRFEPQDYILPTAGGDSPSARLEWTSALLADLEAVRLPGRDPAVVHRMGELLRRFVNAAGFAQHEHDIAQAVAAGRPIFLTIRSSAAELYALPWELLTLKTGQFLGEVEGLLLRFEWPESAAVSESPQPRPEGGRVLVAWSAAAGAVPAAEHVAAIGKACAAGFHPFAPRSDVIAHASLPRIVEALESAQRSEAPVAVLHLLCHGAMLGSTFGLSLDGQDGAVVVDAAQLRQALAPFAKMVRLVVLSACDAGNAGSLGNRLGSIAQALHRCGFAAGIASRFPLSVAGSIIMTEQLYGALLAGPAALESAFLSVRRQLLRAEMNRASQQRQLDWASLQLYARHEDGDDTRPVVFRPFRGLLAFQPEHRRFFFGRDEEVNEVLRDLRTLIDKKRARFLVVAGASGTGKSSLVLAGAVPKLLEAEPQLTFLRMRPGSDPEAALAEALKTRAADAPALLVVDQFEEVFTQTEGPAARQAFARRLWSLASEPTTELRVVITLRVDFIGRCGELLLNDAGLRLDRIAYDEDYRVFIAQLQPQQLRSAILLPAAKVGLELEAGLAERMLQEVGGEPGALPLLEDALDALWLRRQRRVLTQRAYAEVGGVVGALEKRADAIVDELRPADLVIAQRLLTNLVAVADDTALDTRLRVPIGELRQSFALEELPGFERVLKELVAARLLVQDGDDHDQASRVEVAHEALIRKWPRLRGWLNEDRAGLVLQRRVKQAAQEWANQKREESLLYRGGRLAQAHEWRKKWDFRLGRLEKDFLDASEALRLAELRKQARGLRRTRLVAAGFGVLAVLALLALYAARLNAKEASRKTLEANQKSAEAHEGLLVAVAQNRERDPTAVATILREAGHYESRLWTQSAVNALKDGVARAVLRGHEKPVLKALFSADGQKVITAAGDGSVRVFDLRGESGTPIYFEGKPTSVSSLAFSADGRKVATPFLRFYVRIANTDGSGAPGIERRQETYVTAVALNADGTKVATGGDNGSVRVFNTEGAGEPILIKGSDQSINVLAFSADGKRLVIGSRVSPICVVNVDGSGPPISIKGNIGEVTAVAFSRDGQLVAAGSASGFGLVAKADGSSEPTLFGGSDGVITSLAFSPDGKKLVIGSKDATVSISGVDPLVLLAKFKGHSHMIYSVAFSPDGQKIVTASGDHTARIYDAEASNIPLRIWDGSMTPTNAVAFYPDGQKIVTNRGKDLAVILNADGSGQPLFLRGHSDEILAIAISADGKKIVTGSKDKTARIWNADGTSAGVFTGHGDAVTSVAWRLDGKKIVTGSKDKTARIWNADGAGTPISLSGFKDDVTSVGWNRAGTQVVVGSWDKTARIFHADGTGSPISIPGISHQVSAVAFHPDGKKIAVGTVDANLRICEADGRGQSLLLKGHEEHIAALAWSRDGTRIVTGAWDNTARIWNANDTGAPVVLGDVGPITAVAWSPDETKIVTGSQYGVIHVWTVERQALIAAMWEATTDCMPVNERHDLLLESFNKAVVAHRQCQVEVGDASHRAELRARLLKRIVPDAARQRSDN